jgi:hypothetical protein
VKPRFDRFDICEAYLCAEFDFHRGGVLRERPTCARRRVSVEWQLRNLGFQPAASLRTQALTPNGLGIYRALVSRLGLDSDSVAPTDG